jgi:hypothetical protein
LIERRVNDKFINSVQYRCSAESVMPPSPVIPVEGMQNPGAQQLAVPTLLYHPIFRLNDGIQE